MELTESEWKNYQLAPHRPYFYVVEAELLRGELCRTLEVLRDLIVDN